MTTIDWDTSEKVAQLWGEAWTALPTDERARETGRAHGTLASIAGYAKTALDSDNPDKAKDALESILRLCNRG